jgi:hypothetical protein
MLPPEFFGLINQQNHIKWDRQQMHLEAKSSYRQRRKLEFPLPLHSMGLASDHRLEDQDGD